MPTGLDPRSGKAKGEAAIQGPSSFSFPKALRRHPRLRRSVSGTASNEATQFRFHDEPPFRGPITESNPNYNTQRAPRVHRASYVRAEGRSLGGSTIPDHINTQCCNAKRKQEFQRFTVEGDASRKRIKISSSPQGPVKLQEALFSNDHQIISQSLSSSVTKTDINKCVDLKFTGIKLPNVQCKLDHELTNFGNPKITKDVKPNVECLTSDIKRPHLLPQSQKMKDFKKEKNSKFRDSTEVQEKYKRSESSQDYTTNKIIKEIFESRRKISFKIPIKPHQTLQKKAVAEKVFSLGPKKLENKQEKRECPDNSQVSLNLNRHKIEYLFTDSIYKTIQEWKRKRQERQEKNDSRPGKNITQGLEASCSSMSPESAQDTDEEMQIVEELHAARVGKSMDLPVVPSSGEIMSMEIDLVEEDIHSSAENTASEKKLLIVIDTNILMNHLKFVRILKTTEIPGFDRFVLIIPWVVVQELDRLKTGELLKHVQHKAIPAVHFINDSLRSPDRKLWGQSIQLASQKLYGLSDENNDDRVLKCCLQYQELFPCSVVILCTDDRNLRNKGIISGVKSLSKEELSAELLNSSLNTAVCQQPSVSKQQLKAEAPSLKEHTGEESADIRLPILLKNIVSELEKSLGTALSSILETEMKIAFGELWMEMLYLKPPWTLIHLLQCFKKHWLAVFGLVMERNVLLTVEHLYENLCKASNTVDFTTTKFLLQDSMSFLQAFSVRSNYDGVLPQAFAQVNKLRQTFSEVKEKHKPDPSENTVDEKQENTSLMKSSNQEITVSSGSQLAQPNKNQEIWSILENVWITIYQNSTDVFQRLSSSSAPSTSKIASFEEAFIYLQKLMAAVKDILEGIQRILAPNSSCQDVETLYNFLIKYEVNKHVKFTAKELYDCVSQTEYREKLTIGCRQLVEMEYTMQQCNASVYMEAKNRGWCDDTLNNRI
ncbi:PREDICTED: transcriptional protein SWT1-like [Elephantulus edwardii]|uniref:transcriptional protein SWT1-like n=1 Tax=Elephantulus edwardii TaxID=28737 RepID=UPI0003F08E05|nr:PREDICTED: transcriptional protein SWT1-like [Elephantulus edwardii]